MSYGSYYGSKYGDGGKENSIVLSNGVGTLTLENPNPSQVLWKDFGYIDEQGNPVNDPLVSLDGINYLSKVDILLNENEVTQVYVQFTDLLWSKNLTLNKKIRG